MYIFVLTSIIIYCFFKACVDFWPNHHHEGCHMMQTVFFSLCVRPCVYFECDGVVYTTMIITNEKNQLPILSCHAWLASHSAYIWKGLLQLTDDDLFSHLLWKNWENQIPQIKAIRRNARVDIKISLWHVIPYWRNNWFPADDIVPYSNWVTCLRVLPEYQLTDIENKIFRNVLIW